VRFPNAVAYVLVPWSYFTLSAFKNIYFLAPYLCVRSCTLNFYICSAAISVDRICRHGLLTSRDYQPYSLISRPISNTATTPNIRQQSHPSSSALPPYATISKQWKEAVEFVTFHRLNIKSVDLDQLRAIVTNNRFKYLRRLSYTIMLPAYSNEQGRHIESKEEQAISNDIFTQGIVDLFSILSQWEEAGLLSGLRFKIEDPESPADTRDSKTRWDSTYLSLSADERIPTVSGISYLQIQGNYRRKTSPAVAPGLKHSYLV
jgi:hypothetical protein